LVEVWVAEPTVVATGVVVLETVPVINVYTSVLVVVVEDVDV